MITLKYLGICFAYAALGAIIGAILGIAKARIEFNGTTAFAIGCLLVAILILWNVRRTA